MGQRAGTESSGGCCPGGRSVAALEEGRGSAWDAGETGGLRAAEGVDSQVVTGEGKRLGKPALLQTACGAAE